MKAHSSYFRRKNSKQGLALSTAMAICIVLALLVALLVSMATLNITTTQQTVSERDAYIQAKSALAFAESYYAKNQEQVPGNGSGEGTGEALIVFNDSIVANGANVYITKVGTTDVIDPTIVEGYKKNAPDTYVEVTNTASILDLTAYCKYASNDAYTLTKEFKLSSNEETHTNPFTGNIKYTATSDTRYLRIHVRTSPAFNGRPYLYTWYTTVNNAASDSAKGKSSVVNKMSYDTNYASVSNGDWNSSGPVGDCAMTYEGNAWYVTEMPFSTSDSVNFVNAIVTKDGAHRTNGDGSFNRDQQSWEFFGIPVPKDAGASNGLDVYITLNKSTLKDAVESGSKDEFTMFFEETCHADVNDFAKWCSQWYTVYTKKDTYTLHYRKAGNIDDNGGPSGMEYEGYGWYRRSTNNAGDSITIDGHTFSYGSANLVSCNQYGKEIVAEGFIGDNGSGDIRLFNTEEECNQWFVDECGDTSAADYVEVNVKSLQQPVDGTVNTTIEYASKWGSAGALPTPTGGTGSSTDPGDVSTTGSSAPTIQKLANTAVQSSGDDYVTEYAIIGDPFNNWACPEGSTSDNRYNRIGSNDIMTHTADAYMYEVEYPDCAAGHYEFKVIKYENTSDPINWSNSWGNAGGNVVLDIATDGSTLKITFNESTKEINTSVTTPGGTLEGSGNRYAAIGWLNNWGREKDGVTATSADYSLTHEMTYVGGTSYELENNDDIVESGVTYTMKMLLKTADSGAVDWSNSWGKDGVKGTSAANYSFVPPTADDGSAVAYNYTITFDESNHSIGIVLRRKDYSAEDFYLIGSFNNWVDHSFSRATSDLYKMVSLGSDSNGNYTYELTLPSAQEASSTGTEYELRVIGSTSLLDGADPSASDSIDYVHSWGRDDGSGSSMGSEPSKVFTYSLAERSTVKATFYYVPSNPKHSVLTISPTPYNDDDDDSGLITVGFHNGKLVHVTDSTKTTKFEDTSSWGNGPWSKVFVTYQTPGDMKCMEITDLSNVNVWYDIPERSTRIYFSNEDSLGTHTANYQRTVDIPASSFIGKTNPIFIPTEVDTAQSTAGTVTVWKVDNNYADYVTSVSDKSGTDNMVYKGSAQNNYYDAPLVKVLNMLVSGQPDGGGTKYAFAAYPYSRFNVSGVGTLTFNTSNSVTYQGEKYFYIAGKNYGGYSFLIVQDSAGGKGGYLLENHMALQTGVYGGLKTKMNNRGGGVFTSDEYYYDGSSSLFNYGGYTPNWYTYKVPVTTELTIKSIKGVNSDGYNYLSSSNSFTPAKASSYYKQPIYIDMDETGKKFYYSYDTKVGSVDTSSDSKVSVYFDNTDGWSKVKVYAYNPMGETTTQEISVDSTDADHSYYKFTYDEGKYCYFQFFDGTASNPDTTNKKTEVLFLTGNEDSDTHEYNILAIGPSATEFSPYLHPKTKALMAARAIEAAAAAAQIPEKYYYNGATNSFVADGMYSMDTLTALKDAAYSYANSGSSWSASGSADYEELAAAVQSFIKAFVNTRVYIGDEIPDSVLNDPTQTHYNNSNSPYFFKEATYRDDVVVYEDRWVDTLKAYYNNAATVFNSGNSAQSSVAALLSYAADLEAIISAPETALNPDAVQIIVDDQIVTDADGNTSGGWGRTGIHIYNYDASNTPPWSEAGYDLFETTQSDEGYYAYVFKPNLATAYYKIASSKPDDTDGSYFEVVPGTRYIYHTATDTFERDSSISTYKVTYDEIKEGEASGAYSQFKLHTGEKAFVVYFMYDTKVHGGGQDYTIYAGAYSVSATSYRGFLTDISGEKGINLFTNTAKDFFTTPAKYGMSESHDSFSNWTADIPDSGVDIDLMCSGITKSGDISAATSSSKKIGFRIPSTKSNSKITLSQNIELRGGVVSVAAPNIDLQQKDFVIESGTIVFNTDTVVTMKDATGAVKSYKIQHGTYVFNDTASSSTTYTVSLKDPNWKDHFTLVDDMKSSMRGGTFVVKN